MPPLFFSHVNLIFIHPRHAIFLVHAILGIRPPIERRRWAGTPRVAWTGKTGVAGSG